MKIRRTCNTFISSVDDQGLAACLRTEELNAVPVAKLPHLDLRAAYADDTPSTRIAQSGLDCRDGVNNIATGCRRPLRRPHRQNADVSTIRR